jgi:hypothetical protein
LHIANYLFVFQFKQRSSENNARDNDMDHKGDIGKVAPVPEKVTSYYSS